MKTITLLAFFFLVALFASTRAELVRDKEGHAVTNGGTYYIIPQDIEDAAIVTAVINPGSSCELAVVENSGQGKGNATWIGTSYRAGFITTNDSLAIKFNPLPSNACTIHPSWLVIQDDDFEEKPVMVGDKGDFSKPLPGRFYFKTNPNGLYSYNILYRFDDGGCWGIVTIKTDNDGNRRLVVVNHTDDPSTSLIVKLEKRPSDIASHLSMVV